MNGNKPNELILETLRQYPDADNRTLARLLHEKYPHEFKSVDVARSRVRYYRGASGKRNRRLMVHDTKQPHRTPRSIKIPAGLKQVRRAMNIKRPGRYLVLSDLHVPYHDERAIEAALRHGLDHGCEHLVLNGDFLDFYKLSRWSQDPRLRNPHDELQTGAELIKELAKHFAKDAIKVYKIGNHEARYETFLYERAPALVGIEAFELREVLPIDKTWRFVASKQVYRLGKLPLLHGHELPRGLTDPVNIGRGVFLRAAETAMVGHWHRTSTHVETAGLKEQVTPCYSLGCLCQLTPDYATINKWNHGFAIVDVVKGGNYQVQNVIIHKGEVFST